VTAHDRQWPGRQARVDDVTELDVQRAGHVSGVELAGLADVDDVLALTQAVDGGLRIQAEESVGVEPRALIPGGDLVLGNPLDDRRRAGQCVR